MNFALLPSAIENFRNHLSFGFESVKLAYESYEREANGRSDDFAASFEDFFHDWAQSNWELLVERLVCEPQESLVVYGAGSDYEADKHSRVFFHASKPTHEIACVAKDQSIDWITGEVVDLSNFEFDGFVSINGEWFGIQAPFDNVLFSEKNVTGNYQQVVIPLEQVKWQINKI
jgi:hypothetical protein